MFLLYIVVWVVKIWSGLCVVCLGMRELRRVPNHRRPYAIAAFGVAFVSSGVFICVVSSYQTCQIWRG